LLNNEEVAEALFIALTAGSGKRSFYLDIPEPNPGAMALVKRQNLEPVFETGRMFIGKPPVHSDVQIVRHQHLRTGLSGMLRMQTVPGKE
jgi:hypothetical protein